MDINADHDFVSLWKWKASKMKANKRQLAPPEMPPPPPHTFSNQDCRLKICTSIWEKHACAQTFRWIFTRVKVEVIKKPGMCDLMCFCAYMEPVTVWSYCCGQFGGPSDWHWGVKCRCLRCENVSWQRYPPWCLVLHTLFFLFFTHRNGANSQNRVQISRSWSSNLCVCWSFLVWVWPFFLFRSSF